MDLTSSHLALPQGYRRHVMMRVSLVAILALRPTVQIGWAASRPPGGVRVTLSNPRSKCSSDHPTPDELDAQGVDGGSAEREFWDKAAMARHRELLRSFGSEGSTDGPAVPSTRD